MLSELLIENVAVIEKAEIRFTPGLNILTGETGAGKSILIDSINAILGNRTTREVVRTGTDKAVIFASFENISEDTIKTLHDLEYDYDDSLVLYREIKQDGGSRYRINDRPATGASVRQICSTLINIHGQHDNQDILNADRHIYIYDNFCELTNNVSEVSVMYTAASALKRKIDSLAVDDAQKERQNDLLKYQIDEIEKAELYIGEDSELTFKRNAIRNEEQIRNSLNESGYLLGGTEEFSGALTLIYDAVENLSKISEYNDEYNEIYEQINEQRYILGDIYERVMGCISAFEFKGSDISEIEERLDLIYRLKRKYGETVEEILKFHEQAREQLNSIETSDEQLEKLNKEYIVCQEILNERAKILSDKRIKGFKKFEDTIKAELQYLNMEKVQFEVKRTTIPVTSTGIDRIEFYISTNLGEPLKPLSRIASGGELSRIMLAIKNAIAEKDNIETLIFDEIDTGISGNTANKLGRKLKQSAYSRQTICVTHSAQIASFADNHLYIAKGERDGRTYTTVDTLDYEQRTHELARIISGDNITQISIDNAAEMLEIASKDNKKENT